MAGTTCIRRRTCWPIIGLLLAQVHVITGSANAFVYPTETVCRTPKGSPGVCINIKSCPSLLAMLQKPPHNRNSVDYLRQLHCGFENNDPKVCCVDASTQTQRPPSVNDKQPPDVSNHPNLRLLQNNKNCGPINAYKIIGGNKTHVNEIPWMALLSYNVGKEKPEFRCGGSIISKRYILTAAHCITSLPLLMYLIGVRVGEHDITKERDCDDEGTPEEVCAERYQDFEIEYATAHEKYSTSNYHNDIGIIRVTTDIDFRPENVKLVCLPIGSAAQYSSKKFMVSGWGLTEQRVASPVLLKIILPIYQQDECAKTYKRQATIWHKQICVGGERGRDSCNGDSGGPLVAPTVYSGQPRYVQYGVVSFGVKWCGTQGFPGVYTRVDYYLDWILDNMRD